MWRPADAMFWSGKLIALAIALQTLELLALRGAVEDEGVWDWRILKAEFEIFPSFFRWILARILSWPGFVCFLGIRLVAAAVVLAVPSELLSPAWMIFLFLSTMLISLRWRGTFNGGSDYMTLIITLSLSIAQAFAGHPRIVKACLGYIAIQSCASYFIAGLVKIKSPNWRSGRALAAFIATPGYDSPQTVLGLVKNPWFALAASWAVIGLECSFPAALSSPGLCLAFAGTAFLFHLANVYVFGLNRFLFAWAASYPALYWLASR